MESREFFNVAQQCFNDALPFVLYRKPEQFKVKGVFQNDDTINVVSDFSESGFVFAPFNNEDQTIIIPSNHSVALETTFNDVVDVENITNKQIPLDEAKEIHLQLVSNAIKQIEAQQFKKVVVSRKEEVILKETNPFQLFKRLLSQYKTAFVYCWYHPKVGLWLGATPETLLSVVGNRFTTMSLAGTQAYIEDEAPVWQAKEIEEQQLVTDYIVENLKTEVEHFSVGNVEAIKAGNLLHLRTKISGVITSNLKTIIDALHPTPAVCGLPKKETKQFILKEESYNREFYTGFLGELNLKEEKSRNTNRRNVENNAYNSIKTVSNLYVNLRCMQLTDIKANIYVGGGITKDSIPEKEWEETVAKSGTMKSML